MLTDRQYDLMIRLGNLSTDYNKFETMREICPEWATIDQTIDIYMEEIEHEVREIWEELNA